jgi:hypothetical protein
MSDPSNPFEYPYNFYVYPVASGNDFPFKYFKPKKYRYSHSDKLEEVPENIYF